MSREETVVAYSFDFDGSLRHKGVEAAFTAEDISPEPESVEREAEKSRRRAELIIEKNKPLLDGIKQGIEALKQEIGLEAVTVKVFSGSNRQDLDTDRKNTYGSGTHNCSSFPLIEAVAKDLKAELDPFLLADAYADLPEGTAYKKAMDYYQRTTVAGYVHNDPEDKDEAHPSWVLDETKASLLYAQMQKLALESPNKKIIYNFFDDLLEPTARHPGILRELERFYTDHPYLIPENLTLNLRHYAGAKVTLRTCIQGTGPIDVNYRETVEQMAEQCQGKRAEGKRGINVAQNLDPLDIAYIHYQVYYRGLPKELADQLTQLKKEKAKLWASLPVDEDGNLDMAKSTRQDGLNMSNAIVLQHLDNKILWAAKGYYLNHSSDKEAFNDLCTKALIDAQNDLQFPPPELKQILLNLALALVALGLGFALPLGFAGMGVAAAGLALAVGVNYAVNKEFLFFRSKSSEEKFLQGLAAGIKELPEAKKKQEDAGLGDHNADEKGKEEESILTL